MYSYGGCQGIFNVTQVPFQNKRRKAPIKETCALNEKTMGGLTSPVHSITKSKEIS